MRLLFVFIFIFPSFSIFVNAQKIRILSESSSVPIENAAIFNSSRELATLSNIDGIANISNFGENDSIFFQHPTYNILGMLKSEIKDGSIIYLSKRFILIDEFVISATKSRENKRNVPYMIDVIDMKTPGLINSQTSADILTNNGNLIIQKSQGGGGSPILRGFEANKILMVVDGVRMNNAIYRSGHLQNAITIDNAILERAEIIYGPTSLIYGSDALGGVIHYYTRDPQLAKDDKASVFHINAYSQYSTANKGKVGHIDFNEGFKKFGFLTSITYKDFGDIKMGENKNPYYEDFGELKHYVKQINGVDYTVENDNPYIQKNTGYSQIDLLQKIKYSPSQYYDWVLNLQYSTSSDIDRYDQLNDYQSEDPPLMKYAEYYYGPQNRLMTSLKSIVKKHNSLFTNLTSTMAYQRIDEDRISRQFNNREKLFQEEDVDVYSLNLDFLKLVNESNRLNYGIELTANHVDSKGFYRDIETGEETLTQSRYPDGGSSTSSYSAYASYKWLPDPRYVFSAGMRYHYGMAKSNFIAGGVMPYERININNGALTGSLSFIYHPGRKWQISTIASTGFRNPNVDDYGKVRAKSGLVTVPNPDLKPEYTYNAEIGISKTIDGYIKINATGFYTLLTNAIVRSDFMINGSDSLEYDGDMYKIISNSNANRAYIRGISLNVISDLNSNLSFKSSLNLMAGRDLTDNVPMAHIPPVFGRTSVKYNMKKLTTEMFVDYNGWKYIEDFSPLGEDNEEEATQYGFPGWYTLNLRGSYELNRHMSLQLSVDNIFDSFYKPFASGVAGPGRNFVFTLRFRE
jgi:hemoglobin/transferrin/lactoferrin receptor protein